MYMYVYIHVYIYIYVTCMHVCMYVCVYSYTCSNWFIIDIVTVIYCFRMRLSTTPFYSGGVDIFLGYILILTSFLTERTWKSPFQIGRHGAFLKSGYSSISSVYKWFFFFPKTDHLGDPERGNLQVNHPFLWTKKS